jgi:hypothetical protein
VVKVKIERVDRRYLQKVKLHENVSEKMLETWRESHIRNETEECMKTLIRQKSHSSKILFVFSQFLGYFSVLSMCLSPVINVERTVGVMWNLTDYRATRYKYMDSICRATCLKLCNITFHFGCLNNSMRVAWLTGQLRDMLAGLGWTGEQTIVAYCDVFTWTGWGKHGSRKATFWHEF